MSKIINNDGDEICQEPIPELPPDEPVVPTPDNDDGPPTETPTPPPSVTPPGGTIGGGGNICDLPWFRDSLFCAGGGGRTPRDRDSFPCTGSSDNSNCFTMFTVEGWTCNSDGTIRENRSSTTSNCVSTYRGFPRCGCSQDGIFMGCCYLKTWAWPVYPCCPAGGGPFYLQVNDRNISRETIKQNGRVHTNFNGTNRGGNYSVFRDDSGECYYTSYSYDPISIPLDSDPKFVSGDWIDDCDDCKNYKFNKICTEEECGGASSFIIANERKPSGFSAFDKIKVTFDDGIESCYEYSNTTCDEPTLSDSASWSNFNGLSCSDCCKKYELTPCIEYGTDCGFCDGGDPDVTPKYITVYPSLVSCPDCYGLGATSMNNINVILPTTVLTQSGCQWTATGVGSWEYDSYAGGDVTCAGAVDTHHSGTLTVSLTKTGANAWTFGIVPGGTPVAQYCFSDDNMAGIPCNMDIPDANNEWGCGAPPPVPYVPGQVLLESSSTASFVAGAYNTECPGGESIITDTNLAGYVGGVAKISGVWYSVEEYLGALPSDGPVSTPSESGANCAAKCV